MASPSANDWSSYNPVDCLKDYTEGQIQNFVDRISDAVNGSFRLLEELGLTYSQYPGEGDLDVDGECSKTTYLIGHLLHSVFDKRTRDDFGSVPELEKLLRELKPEEFISLIVLYTFQTGGEISRIFKPLSVGRVIGSKGCLI